MGYWRHVARFGWQSYWSRIHGGWRNVIGFLINAVVVMAVVFYLPWFGDVKEESRLVGATVAAFLSTGMLWLIIDFIRAPRQMNELSRNRMRDFEYALRLQDDVTAVRKSMMELCKAGRVLLKKNASISEIEDWKVSALQALKEHYDDTHVYEFENETPFPYTPKTDALRATWLVEHFERTTLSWSSKAERMQELFYPKKSVVPWLENANGSK